MKTAYQLGISAVLLCYATFAAAQEPAGAAIKAPYAGATISDFKGKVGIRLPGQTVAAPVRGEVLPPETEINTDDGRLLLNLSDGSYILLRSHTRLLVKQPETSGWRYLQLVIGRIHAQIQKHLGGTPPLEIGTPGAVIGVRGTRFDVEVDRRGYTEVDVEEGLVELDSLNGHGEGVLIPAGFSSRVGIESGPEKPRPTDDLRPQVDRPGHRKDGDTDDDDPIKRLQDSDPDRRSDRQATGAGNPSSGSDGDNNSGDSSGSDRGRPGSDGDAPGSKPPEAS
jgi:hypothetical protein